MNDETSYVIKKISLLRLAQNGKRFVVSISRSLALPHFFCFILRFYCLSLSSKMINWMFLLCQSRAHKYLYVYLMNISFIISSSLFFSFFLLFISLPNFTKICQMLKGIIKKCRAAAAALSSSGWNGFIQILTVSVSVFIYASIRLEMNVIKEKRTRRTFFTLLFLFEV